MSGISLSGLAKKKGRRKRTTS
ncbi:hypothetical protein KIPB_012765, partial [Kipferlia bialata]|eukprot:g12765.t1